MKLTKVTPIPPSTKSRWEATTDQGEHLVLEFKNGMGTVTRYSSQWWTKADIGIRVNSFLHGDALDSYITLERFASLSGLQLPEDSNP